MSAKEIWETFFDAHAPLYDGNVFVKNTIAEVDFLVEELSLKPGATILDVGCGTGRHSIELARRGFTVTGLDLSTEMLAQATEKAKAAGVQVTFVHGDAKHFSFPHSFDAIIGLCEGGFSLLGQHDDPIEQPLSILRNVCRVLNPGGRVMFTVLNAAALFRKYTNDDVANGLFNPETIVESYEMAPRDGTDAIPVRERAFVATELRLLFQLAGMTVHAVWGGTAGNWGRRVIDLDEIELMIVARKSE